MGIPDRFQRGLILIPTPIAENLPLEPGALAVLSAAAQDPDALVLVEEHKIGRRRWIEWGLPRETIERFIEFNEHTATEKAPGILSKLKSGGRAVILSDGGLPAFCDPGKDLVNLCHESGIPVTATPFPNSIALALSLSGFDHREFHFSGFLPADAHERKASLKTLADRFSCTLVLMDTPYRLQSLLKDVAGSSLRNRPLFLATSLNSPDEALYRGNAKAVLDRIGALNKVEFVLVIG